MDSSFAETTITVGSKRKQKESKQKTFVDDQGGYWSTKEYQQYVKSYSQEEADGFLQKDSESLKKAVVHCLLEIAEETEQVEQNEEYQKLKEDLKAFTDSLKEATKPLKATIGLATLLLRERGESIGGLEKSIKALKDMGATIEVKCST